MVGHITLFNQPKLSLQSSDIVCALSRANSTFTN